MHLSASPWMGLRSLKVSVQLNPLKRSLHPSLWCQAFNPATDCGCKECKDNILNHCVNFKQGLLGIVCMTCRLRSEYKEQNLAHLSPPHKWPSTISGCEGQIAGYGKLQKYWDTDSSNSNIGKVVGGSGLLKPSDRVTSCSDGAAASEHLPLFPQAQGMFSHELCKVSRESGRNKSSELLFHLCSTIGSQQLKNTTFGSYQRWALGRVCGRQDSNIINTSTRSLSGVTKSIHQIGSTRELAGQKSVKCPNVQWIPTFAFYSSPK